MQSTNKTLAITHVKNFLIGLCLSALILLPCFIFLHGSRQLTWTAIVIALAAFVVSIPVHEVIHAVMCCLLSENNINTIRIGANWKTLNAYCSYQLPVRNQASQIAITMMPGVLLGLVPAIMSLCIGTAWLCLFSLLSLAGASGDTVKAYKLINQQK